MTCTTHEIIDAAVTLVISLPFMMGAVLVTKLIWLVTKLIWNGIKEEFR